MKKRHVYYECYQDVDSRYQDFLENILESYGFHKEHLNKIECVILDMVYFGINEILEGIIIGINDKYTANKLHKEYFKANGWTMIKED